MPHDEAPRAPAARCAETILLIDDEPVIRQLMAKALSDAGYRVLEGEHGAHALRLFARERAAVDLLVTDMRMPVMGGAELVAALQEENPALPVLCITGYPLSVPADLSTHTLYKPFSREQFLCRVRERLDQKYRVVRNTRPLRER